MPRGDRRTGHPHHRLTDLSIRQARPGRHADGNGLYLVVRPSGARAWVQRVVIGGRRRDLGLGGYPLVPLAEARRAALDNRRVARAGGDPTAGRPEAAGPTFREAAEDVLKVRRGNWRNPGTEAAWRRNFENRVFEHVGDMPVGQVSLDDLLPIVAPLWKGRGSIGYVMRQQINQVMQWAIAHGHRRDNPAEQMKILLPKTKSKIKHRASLPYREIRGAMAAAAAAAADEAVKLALLFLVLCASRVGEVVGARWCELDLGERNWILPKDRMKAENVHRVPLSDQALEVIERARALGRSETYIFSLGKNPVKANLVLKLVASLGLVDEERRKIVPHGFRSTFRVWAAEEGEAGQEVCEAALAHTQSDQTIAAYVRTDLFEKRRQLMQLWADYVVPKKKGGEVAAPHPIPQNPPGGSPTSDPT